MDDSLKIKKMERETVELIVAKELIGFATEAAIKALESLNSAAYHTPDTRAWARKIIAIVKEHSN